MDVKVLEKAKNEIKVEFSDPTFSEILRIYLNKDSDVTFAAWKKEHQTMNPMLLVKTKSKDAKSVLESAIKAVLDDLEKVESSFKTLK